MDERDGRKVCLVVDGSEGGDAGDRGEIWRGLLAARRRRNQTMLMGVNIVFPASTEPTKEKEGHLRATSCSFT